MASTWSGPRGKDNNNVARELYKCKGLADGYVGGVDSDNPSLTMLCYNVISDGVHYNVTPGTGTL